MPTRARIWFVCCWCSSLLAGTTAGQGNVRFGEPRLDGVDEVSVRLVATPDTTISGVRLKILGHGFSGVEPSGTPAGWRTFVSPGDTIHLVSVDTTARNPVMKGEPVAYRLRFSGRSAGTELSVLHAEFATAGQPPGIRQPSLPDPASIPRGTITVESGDLVTGALGALRLRFTIPTATRGLQFDLMSDRPLGLTLLPDTPILGVDAYAATIDDSTSRLIMAALDGTVIPPGTATAELPVFLSRTADAGSVSVRVSSARLHADDGPRSLLGGWARLSVLRRTNRPPTVEPLIIHTREGDPLDVTLVLRDEDADPVLLLSTDLPPWISHEPGGQLAGAPAQSEIGNHAGMITVSDSIDTIEVPIEIRVENRPPAIVIADQLAARAGKPLSETMRIRFCKLCDIRVEGLAGAVIQDSVLTWLAGEPGPYRARLSARDAHEAETVAFVDIRVTATPRVRIDEVLADPPRGLAGDVNGDGGRDGFGDEFVEIVNLEDTSVDVSGWLLSDDDTKAERAFHFPDGTVLGPGERAVLFGTEAGDFPHGRVFADDGRIGNGLTNAGDGLLLVDPAWDDTVDAVRFTHEEGLSGSFVRWGDALRPHSSYPTYEPMSPGRPGARFHDLRITVDPTPMSAGTPSTIAVEALYDDGHVADVTNEVAWAVSHDVVRVTERSVTADGPGHFAVSARWNGFRRDRQVRAVAPPPAGVVPADPLAGMPAPPFRLRVGRPFCWYPDVEARVSVLANGRELTPTACWTPVAAEPGSIVVNAQMGGRTWRRAFPFVVESRPRIRITEVYVAPYGDANGDGHVSAVEDEFVEIRNEGDAPVDVSGWTLSDDDTGTDGAFTFPVGTWIAAGGRAVLFGGGRVVRDLAMAFVDDGTIGNGLADGGERLLLIDPAFGDTIDAARVAPQADGSASIRVEAGWVSHADRFVGPYSPGAAGTPLPPMPVRNVRIVEVHPSPAPGPRGDTNQDGVRDAFADEFVELLSRDSSVVDMGGWSIEVGARGYTFPDAVLSTGERCVVFGGGEPAGISGVVLTAGGRLDGGLPNGGGRIRLVDPAGRTVDEVAYGRAVPGVSLVYEDTGHRAHNALPGRDDRSPGLPSPHLVDLVASSVGRVAVGDTLRIAWLGVFDDGETSDLSSEDVTVVSACPGVDIRGADVFAALTTGDCRIRAMAAGVAADILVRIEDAPASEPGPAVPDRLTMIAGSDAELSLPGLTPTAATTRWIDRSRDTAAGTPEGDWRLSFTDTRGDTVTIAVRTVSPERILADAPGTANVGLTWVWPIPVRLGFEIQAGDHGAFDAVRHAVVWRPDPHLAGRRFVDIAVSAPGVAPTILTKPVDVGAYPAVRVAGVSAVPAGDANGDGVTDAGDAFIRLANDGADPVDVGGWQVGGSAGEALEIPRGTVLGPYEDKRVFVGPGAEAFRLGLERAERLLLVAPTGPDTIADVALSAAGVPAAFDHQADSAGAASDPVVDGPPPSASRRDSAGIVVAPSPSTDCVKVSVAATEPRETRVVVYNALGQTVDEIFAGRIEEGISSWRWCARDGRFGTGVYLIAELGRRPPCVGRAVILQ